MLGLVLRKGIFLTAVGLAIGAALGAGLNVALRSVLPRAGALDPATIALVSLVLFGIALLASWLPARRATRINPLDALRAD